MLHMAIADLCNELQEAKKEACVLRKNLSFQQERVNIRNIHKRERRKVKRLARQEEVINKLARENEQLLLMQKKLQSQLQKNKEKATMKLKRCQKKFNKAKMCYKSRLRRMRRAEKPTSVESESDTEYTSEVVSGNEVSLFIMYRERERN